MVLIKKYLTKIIEAAILLTLGILIILAGAGDGHSANTVSTIIGVVACIVGGLTLVLLAIIGIRSRASFAAVAVSSASLLGVGISLFVNPWVMSLVTLLIFVIPYVLITVGAVIILDGVLVLFRAIKGKGLVLPACLSIVSGVAALVFGCLCVGDNPVIKGSTQLIIFGIIIVVLAAVALLTTLANAAKDR